MNAVNTNHPFRVMKITGKRENEQASGINFVSAFKAKW
jgi:hypothetical protein